MRAIVISDPGGPDALELREVDAPAAGPDDLLVDVRATAVNRADVLQRMGLYPDPRPWATLAIPGLEFAGTVAARGDRVVGWSVGDPVMGIEAGGCYAEQVVTNARQAMPLPEGLAIVDAAAVPEVFLTAWDALVVQGGLTSRRWALVHAGASGVGTAAIQIARAIGARVAVTCSAAKADACRELGADLVLERSPADWAGELADVMRAEGRSGVDVVLDVVGGDEVARNLRVIRPQGTVVQVGLMGGGTTRVDVGALLTKRLTWIGTTLRARPLEEKIAISRRFVAEVLPLFTSGELRPVIDRRFPLADARAAHELVESNATIGKVLLDVVSSIA